ncbi:inositol monophosphatase family protein [Schumannella sp. 10F1B-5-1]|uniref:inositol monophosphatase family protein n=1 Tax=Schumannella sp. 10F1B-5-1 TaxID=2590780 RepID=UPI00113079FD|nr:inositol monophosphatase family protein [Schumannella sp. 10F1B-5-1]TPW71554.1 inositol monophosphatase [Schumannella sp. 10F1B-5-1]
MTDASAPREQSAAAEQPAPADLLALAREIALEAGELAARRRAEGVEVAAAKSSPVDIVTAADREVEQLVRARLAAARPDDGILGEEGGSAGGTSGLTWVVDPIDGTVNYLYGIPHYGVSIAVVQGDPDPQRWTALAGCVFSPGEGELFTASRGGGAHLETRPRAGVDAPLPSPESGAVRALQVREPMPLGQVLMATGFSYDAERRAHQAQVIERLMPHLRDIRRFGAAALDLTALAAGRVDLYAERYTNAWDFAAGVLIAREAGAAVVGHGGAEPDTRMVLGGHPEVVAAFAPLLADAGF